MNCSVCDLLLDTEWKYCPACGYDVKVRADGKNKPGGPESFAPPTNSGYGPDVRSQVFEVIVRQALAGAPWRSICAGPMMINNISVDEVVEECRRRQGLLSGQPAAADKKAAPKKQPPTSQPAASPNKELPKANQGGAASGWNASTSVDWSKASIANPDQSGSGWGQPDPAPKASKQNPTQRAGWEPNDANIDDLFTVPVGSAANDTPSRRLDKVKNAVQSLLDGEENDVAALKRALSNVLSELNAAMSSIQQQQQVLDEVEREAELRRDLDRELRRTNGQFGPNTDPGKHFFT